MIMKIIIGVLGALSWFLALGVVFSCFRLHGECGEKMDGIGGIFRSVLGQ